jgi:hypothetical protein
VPCKGRGYFEEPDKRTTTGYRIVGCEGCRGFGKRVCTIRDLRVEYRRIRNMFEVERGFASEDFDAMIEQKVKKLEHLGIRSKASWFDCAFFLARDYDLLSKWWTIQRFGRK